VSKATKRHCADCAVTVQ